MIDRHTEEVLHVPPLRPSDPEPLPPKRRSGEDSQWTFAEVCGYRESHELRCGHSRQGDVGPRGLQCPHRGIGVLPPVVRPERDEAPLRGKTGVVVPRTTTSPETASAASAAVAPARHVTDGVIMIAPLSVVPETPVDRPRHAPTARPVDAQIRAAPRPVPVAGHPVLLCIPGREDHRELAGHRFHTRLTFMRTTRFDHKHNLIALNEHTKSCESTVRSLASDRGQDAKLRTVDHYERREALVLQGASDEDDRPGEEGHQRGAHEEEHEPAGRVDERGPGVADRHAQEP